MNRTRVETGQPINREKIETLHYQHLNLAKDAQKKGDKVLSQSHYQQAEYYLHLINESTDGAPTAATNAGFKNRKAVKDSNISRASHNETADSEEELPKKEGKVLPFKGSFLFDL